MEMATREFPRKKDDVISSVQKFLADNPRKNPFKDNRPGTNWFKVSLLLGFIAEILKLAVELRWHKFELLTTMLGTHWILGFCLQLMPSLTNSRFHNSNNPNKYDFILRDF